MALFNSKRTQLLSGFIVRTVSLRFIVACSCSWVEVQSNNYYNTLSISGPNGNILGRVRKSQPAVFEGYSFAKARASDGHTINSHVVDTPIGRVIYSDNNRSITSADWCV